MLSTRRSVLLAAAVLAVGVAILGPVGGLEAAGRIRVVTSLTDLKSLTEAVGGDLVTVESLARGDQNAHDIELRPSLMLRLRRADLLVRNGAGGDPWVEPLVVGSQNPRILPGAPGHVDASQGVGITPPDGPVSRERGDVHPEGDPHYTLDPANAAVVTANIVAGLARVAPEHAATFEARRREFLRDLETAMARWQQTLAPFRGTPVVTYHESFNYFLRRFDLTSAGTIENRPGIPPSPGHLVATIQTIQQQRIKVVVAEPFADQRIARRVARDGGARLLVLPSAVDGMRGVDTYLGLFDHNVKELANALR
jgi:ABC-type Zn uptake system ZnuABC Zn-binding protein ZnuA